MSRSGIIGALVVIGIGLALRYAVSPGLVSQVDLEVIGAILIVLGLIGGLLALVFAVADLHRKNKETNAHVAAQTRHPAQPYSDTEPWSR
jgi:phosphate/sulfate permease